MTTDTRAFEMTIEIAASPEAVWQAITDAQDLVRWFPLEATIEPRAGGTWMVSWDGNWPWETTIEIWEPNRHLRVIDRKSRPYNVEGTSALDVTPMAIALDWHLEAKGGSTTVRLVHSGFGRGSGWDEEFEGVSLGWLLELNGLKHYLERHRGTLRRVSWVRRAVEAPVPAVWNQLVAPSGILADPSIASLPVGSRYRTTLSTGDVLEGLIVATVPGRALQITVDGLNDALFRFWVDRVGTQASINAWLSLYEGSAADVLDFDHRMRDEVERIARKCQAVGVT
jgi:uncharacterized protein YndB with AHSA1/START domain